MVTFSGELLAPCSAAVTVGNWKTTSSPRASGVYRYQAEQISSRLQQNWVSKKKGGTILSYDGANAFNGMYSHRFLPALAEIVPSVVPYAANLHAQEPPKLPFARIDGGGLIVVSARGVGQGCNMGPLCYSAGSPEILKEFNG